MNTRASVTVVCVFLLLAMIGLAETPKTATRPSIKDSQTQAFLREFDAAEAKAKAEYDRAVKVARTELVKKLQARLDSLTKSGRLDDAVAVRDVIETTKEKPAMEGGVEAPHQSTFMSDVDVIGTWLEGNGTKFVLTANGHFMYAGNQPGTWRLSDDALILTWKKGRVDSYTKLDGDQLTGESTTGGKVAIRKSK